MRELIQLLISCVLSALIGIERERFYKPAGLRTHTMIGLASTLLTLLSLKLSPFAGVDVSRIIASIFVGIGFIGAGTIIKVGKEVMGITTAASIWLVAAIGVAVGLEEYWLALCTTLLALLILALKPLERAIRKKK